MRWKKIILLVVVFSIFGCKEGKKQSTEDYITIVGSNFDIYAELNDKELQQILGELKKLDLLGEHPLDELDITENFYVRFSFQIRTDYNIEIEQIIIGSLPYDKIIILLDKNQKTPTVRFKFIPKKISKTPPEKRHGEINPAVYIKSLYIFTATIRISPEDWEKIKDE